MITLRDAALIWTRPEPSTRRPRFTREQIAVAALSIADTEGLSAVSMRRVAAELRAGTMTLYYYIETKDELIALMDDAIIAEQIVPEEELPAGWYDGLTAIARRTRSALTRHPWVLAMPPVARLGPNAMRHLEQSLTVLASTPLGATAKLELLAVVEDFVRGNALRSCEVTARAARAGDEDQRVNQSPEARARQFVLSRVRTGRYPHIQGLIAEEAVPASWGGGVGPSADEDRFERGLHATLRGAASQFGLPPPAAREA